jgi:hypothetical protein
MKRRIALMICLPLLLAAAGSSQTAITGAPYVGEEVAERTQTLPDGTQVSEKTVGGRLYRDSQGRTRTERRLSPDSANQTLMVEIVDPAAGVRYALDAQNKVAHRSALAPLPGGAGKTAASGGAVSDSAAPQPAIAQQQSSLEPLGMRMMDGVVAEGKRILTTILPGPESNDRLVVVATEMWVSRELGITLASRVSDPRMGEVTYRVGNVTLGEPDARLFQAPEDYTIVDSGTGTGLPPN